MPADSKTMARALSQLRRWMVRPEFAGTSAERQHRLRWQLAWVILSEGPIHQLRGAAFSDWFPEPEAELITHVVSRHKAYLAPVKGFSAIGRDPATAKRACAGLQAGQMSDADAQKVMAANFSSLTNVGRGRAYSGREGMKTFWRTSGRAAF